VIKGIKTIKGRKQTDRKKPANEPNVDIVCCDNQKASENDPGALFLYGDNYISAHMNNNTKAYTSKRTEYLTGHYQCNRTPQISR
jgi:hypothetical protein